MAKKIINKKVISNPEMLEVLSKEGEMDTLQRRTYEYVTKFSKLSPQTAKKLKEELLKVGDITEEEAAMIVNIVPQTAEEIRDIFHHRKTILPSEFIEKIINLVKSAISESREK